MTRTPRTSRRDFLAISASGAAAGVLGGNAAGQEAGDAAARIETPPDGAASKDTIRVAVVGLRGRGWNHVLGLHGQPGCEVVALCDVDSAVLSRRADECLKGSERLPAFQVETTGDMRTLLDREDIDAIAIATPNHTHSMLACWALDAGKHVYVEKPVSHVVEEGARIVEAARRSGRICATGTQGRSARSVRDAIEFIHGGGLGEVHCSRGLCYKPRRSIGRSNGPRFVPATVDYDRWLGPVEYRPLARPRLHYDWHWDLHTGNGDLGNQGIHQMDIARWALGHDSMPRQVMSIGGRLGYVDDGDSPNTQVTSFDCDGRPLIFEVRGLPRDRAEQSDKWRMDTYEGQSIGNVIHGEKGIVRISNSYSWADFIDRDGNKVLEWKGDGDHFANFVEAVRANDASRLNASIEDGHLSSAFCHLGILSHRLGTPMAPSEIDRRVASFPTTSEAWGRMRDHLVANGVDLESEQITFGRTLAVDDTGEIVLRDPEATAMLTRTARPPFDF
ncbi:MAG: Gfo/Idh/MocA family oxidoreductase [Phycisphaera sp.]|nr:Gfo/Idh/MocA family oxidoreductase [Phycisphaera sp.]